ncbi:2Fe-2S iron-sulfur cluster binding domain-containing protein [Bacillus aerolatus]|uniref:2Fe-2S iron-sulfur cluster binding domain-containing protein n=1 Tax=Bacillus aerolatus TaxID=2653354 RepID=A0A6I1FU25_9BACI|nr:2Fe-2S iron-sulfur cluster-binding protein [Bacillus aerolatus]KAB7705978.1 2Fe-2S iron-sulfur cluster binding domain-containing protein [Bacillus aerolatus]
MDNRKFTVGSLLPNQLNTDTAIIMKQPEDKQPENVQEDAHIHLQQNQQTFRIKHVKGNLLNEALKQDQAINFKCRKGTCGVCTVKITEGALLLSPPNEKEQKKLQHALTDGCRLACQANML